LNPDRGDSLGGGAETVGELLEVVEVFGDGGESRDGAGWDGAGWDGVGWDGVGWDGAGWDGAGVITTEFDGRK
jgi:hypothetical protein